MQIIIAILALSFLIIVHELGHFAVAKFSGIKVHEFALFMGPKLFSIRKGETLYTLRAVPIGGFVRMEGEEQASEDSRAYNQKPIPVRMAVIAAGPLMNLLVAVILIFIITSVSGYDSTKVSELQSNSPAYEAGLRPGDQVLSFDGKRIYTPMDIQTYLFESQGKAFNLEVLQGSTQEKRTFLVEPEVFPKERYILGFSAGGTYGKDSNKVADVAPNSASYKAGLRKDDIIVGLNGQQVSDGSQIREFLKTNKAKVVDVVVERNGEEKILKITPQLVEATEQFSLGLPFTNVKSGLGENISQSVKYSYSMTRYILKSLGWLVTGKVSFKEMSGPVGIVSAIGTVVEGSETYMDKLLNLMHFTAIISINLGLFNLIPFPALDGSKLIILSVEGIRRKALPPEREAFISLIGLALLVMLMIFATFNDVLRMTGKG